MREELFNDVPLLRAIVSHGRNRGDHIAIHCGTNQYNYAKFVRRFERVTAHLAGTWGVTRGQHVATLAANDDLQLVVLMACVRLGAVWVPLDPTLGASSVAHQLKQVDARLLIADIASLPLAEGIAAQSAQLSCALLDHLIDRPAPYGLSLPQADKNLPAVVLFDAQLSAEPKRIRQEDMLVDHIGLRAEDNVLIALSLARFPSLMTSVPALACGATVTLLPRFEPQAWIDAVGRHRPTVAMLTVEMAQSLHHLDEWQTQDACSLRSLGVVDGPLEPSLATALRARGLPLEIVSL
jgi:fatty-acyl-CoA synthase